MNKKGESSFLYEKTRPESMSALGAQAYFVTVKPRTPRVTGLPGSTAIPDFPEAGSPFSSAS